MQVNHTNLYLQVTPERPKHGPKGFKKVFVHQVTSPVIKGTVVKKKYVNFFSSAKSGSHFCRKASIENSNFSYRKEKNISVNRLSLPFGLIIVFRSLRITF